MHFYNTVHSAAPTPPRSPSLRSPYPFSAGQAVYVYMYSSGHSQTP